MNHTGESEQSVWGHLFSTYLVSFLQFPSLLEVRSFKIFPESKRMQRKPSLFFFLVVSQKLVRLQHL